MPTTFTDIVTEALARDYGANTDTTNMGLFVNDANAEVHAAFRWSWAETFSTLTSVAGTETLTVPADLLYVGRIRPNDAVSPELIYLDPGLINEDSPLAEFNPTAAGQRNVPRYITRWGSNFYLDPTPDAVYTWRLYYWKAPTTLSGVQTPDMPVADREVLVYGALVRAAERDRQWDAAQFWKQRFDEKLEQMKQKDQALVQSARYVSMPRSYGRRFRK